MKGYFEKTNAQRLAEMPTATRESDKEAVMTVFNEASGAWGIRVQRNALPGYGTADWWEARGMWKDWKTFGYPNGGGSMDQPALWLDVVRLLQSCAESMGVS